MPRVSCVLWKIVCCFICAMLFLPGSFQIVRAQSIKAVGSSGVVTISWEPVANAQYYSIKRLSPNPDELFPKPFSGTSWIDTKPNPDTNNVYQVSAYDENLKVISILPTVSAKPDKTKPTLLKPCSVVLSFTIGDKNYSENGQLKSMSAAPVVQDGRSYLVIRYVVEPLYGKVLWDAITKKVTLQVLGHTIVMWVGSSKAIVDGKERLIDAKNPKVTPFIKSGRTYVPLRFPVEALGTGSIDWFAKTKTAVLSFPFGCDQQIEGSIENTAMDTFQIKDLVFKSSPPWAPCAFVRYTNVGSVNHIGQIVGIPCASDCLGEKVTGEVLSIENSTIVILDQFGKIKTYQLGSNVVNRPKKYQCISACFDNSYLTSVTIAPCGFKIFEGEIRELRCDEKLVFLTTIGRSYTIKLPANFPCETITVGQCLRVEGEASLSDPTIIEAQSVTIISCPKGVEYTLIAWEYAKDGESKAADFDGNTFTVTFPPDFSYADVKPGDCLKIVGTQKDSKILAYSVEIIQAPYESNIYHKAVVVSDSPLIVIIPGGSKVTVTRPPYYNAKFTPNLTLEIWGKINGDNLKAIKIETSKDFKKTFKGKIIGIVCDSHSIFLQTEKDKLKVTLPMFINCEQYENDQCLSIIGMLESSDSLLAVSVEKIECPSGCISGESVKGRVVGIDCTKNEVRLKLESDKYLYVTLPKTFPCDDIKIGVCLEACGTIEIDKMAAQTIVVSTCPEELCIGKYAFGIITKIDCTSGLGALATEKEIIPFIVPETVDCSNLAVGFCAQVCVTTENSGIFVSLSSCSKLGQVVEGTIIETSEKLLTINTKSGEQIFIETSSKLSVGTCIIVIGEFKIDTKDQLLAKIIATIPCVGGVGNIGEIIFIDCESSELHIKTETGLQGLKLPKDSDCKIFLPGDCVFVRNEKGETIVNKTSCPELSLSHIPMLVVGFEGDNILATGLSTLDLFKVRGIGKVAKGDVVLVSGHKLNARTIENATFIPIDKGCVISDTLTLKFVSYNKTLKLGSFVDIHGNREVILSPDEKVISKTSEGEILSMVVSVFNAGFGQQMKVAKEIYTSNELSFNLASATGVVFAIDTVEEVIMLHTESGDNVVVAPSSTSILKVVKIGDCASVTGALSEDKSIIKNAKLEINDCSGGTLGRSFTGVIVGVNATDRTIDVAANIGGTYEVTVEAVSMLSGLSLGDCVAISGIILSINDSNKILGKMVARIDCKEGGNEPTSVEGEIASIDSVAKMVQVDSYDGGRWTCYLEHPELCPNVSIGTPVRVSGRLQAKSGVISRAYLKKVVLPTSRWSLIGTAFDITTDSFKLKDSNGRTWGIIGSGELPKTDDRLLVVGLVSTDGVSEIEDATWTNISNWPEPKTDILGTVFGLSCGMDKLLIRDKNTKMTSLRLPHTGFCGTFSIGECVGSRIRFIGNIPTMAKVTDVTSSHESCYNQTVFGKIIGKSTSDKIIVIATFDGRQLRLGFETELQAGKMSLGDAYKVFGRYLPTAPDTLKVDSFELLPKEISYETTGRIVLVGNDSFLLEELSGRIINVTNSDKKIWNAWLSSFVKVSGTLDGTNIKATRVERIEKDGVAVEFEGEVIEPGEGSSMIKDNSNNYWKIEGSFGRTSKGKHLFVVGTMSLSNWWTVQNAKIVDISGPKPFTQMLCWGTVESTACDKNKVTIHLDDNSTYEIHPEDMGICETFTPGEHIQVGGVIVPGKGRFLAGARLLRSGTSGAKKIIIGTVVEISCTSRILKLREDEKPGLIPAVWTIKLDKSVNCDLFKVGDRVKIIGDPVLTNQYILEDAMLENIGGDIVPVKISGMLISLDCDKNILIFQSEGRLYRIYPAADSYCSELFAGDLLDVEGKVSIYRRTIIMDTHWKRLPDKDAYLVFTGKVDFASCPQIRLLTDYGEYWRINIRSDQPCDKLDAGMTVTIKGIRDLAQDHLMHHAYILNLMRKKVIVGVIEEILCLEGKALILDNAGAVWEVFLQTSNTDCLERRFSKGDTVQATGFQNVLYPGSELDFAELETFGVGGFLPVDFVGELLDVSDCKRGIIQVRTNHLVWRIRVPEGFSCTSITPGDWLHIKGGRESFPEKIIQASVVEKSKTTLYGYVIEANYAKGEIYCMEIQRTEIKWTIRMADPTKSNAFKKGMYIKVVGNNTSGRTVSDAELTEMKTVKGVISDIENINQIMTIKGTDFKTYIVHVQPTLINLDDFKVGLKVIAVGIATKSDANELIETWVEVDKKGSY